GRVEAGVLGTALPRELHPLGRGPRSRPPGAIPRDGAPRPAGAGTGLRLGPRGARPPGGGARRPPPGPRAGGGPARAEGPRPPREAGAARGFLRGRSRRALRPHLRAGVPVLASAPAAAALCATRPRAPGAARPDRRVLLLRGRRARPAFRPQAGRA